MGRIEDARARLKQYIESGESDRRMKELFDVKLTHFCPHCNKECVVDILFHGDGDGALQCMECYGRI